MEETGSTMSEESTGHGVAGAQRGAGPLILRMGYGGVGAQV